MASTSFPYDTRLNVLYKPLEVIDEKALTHACEHPWYNQTLCKVNDSVVRLGVVTSKHREMTLRTLTVCGIAEHFEVIITPEDVSRGKPDPEPVAAALARLSDARPDRVLFVGDAPVDVQAGRAAGVLTAGALWGPFGYDKLSAATVESLCADLTGRLRQGHGVIDALAATIEAAGDKLAAVLPRQGGDVNELSDALVVI